MENLKLIMSKAFFINANMCCVRRAGTELSADQLVLPYLHVTCINFLNTFLSVPLSCAAEARNTLPAAFSLVEKATGPGSRIMQASLTRREYDC